MAASVVALPVTSSIASAQVLRQSRYRRPVRLLTDLRTMPDSLRYDDIDAVTVERVKSHVIDTLGCVIAAFDEAPVRICRDLALPPAGRRFDHHRHQATQHARAQHHSPMAPAFRYYDLNDTYASATFRSGPSERPCRGLSRGRRVRRHASAAELVTAIVSRTRVNCRLLDAFDAATRGWDSPVFSLPAVALAAGKLMRLPAELAQAVNWR